MPSAFGNAKLGYARAKRKGFSLIVVLIVAIIGLAIVGTMVQMTVTSGGGGRVSSASGTKYNFMQDAVEKGKAALKESMNHTGDAPRFVGYYSTTPPVIAELDHLLISQDFPPISGNPDGIVEDRAVSKAELGRLGIAGNGGTMLVKIYDMQYPTDPSILTLSSSSPDFNRLPPSIILTTEEEWDDIPTAAPPWWKAIYSKATPDSNGVYLVRAVLTIGGKETVLDSSVVQSTNK